MAASMQWDEIIKSTAVAYVNHALTLFSGYIATKLNFQADVLSPENLLVLSTALVALVASVIMRTIRQKQTHNLVEAAREASPETKFATIQNNADEKPILGS